MREVYTGMNPNEIESECLNGIYNEIANVIGIPLLKIKHTSAYISDFNRAQEVRNEMNKHRECIEKLINE